MDITRNMGSCLMIVALGAVLHLYRADGQCSFPAEVVGNYWTRYDAANSRDIITEYTTTNIIVKDAATNSQLEVYQCDEGSSPYEVQDWNYYVVSPSPAGTPKTCRRIRQGHPQTQFNVLISWNDFTPLPASPVLADCQVDANYQQPAGVLVRPPGDANANTASPECNFGNIAGKYLVSYNGGTCDGDSASILTITATDITIDSCFTGTNVFMTPINGGVLKCSNILDQNDVLLGGLGLGNSLVIFNSDSNDLGRTVYYCARLETRISGVPAPGRVFLSLDVTDPDTLECQTNQAATSSGLNGNNRTYLAFALTPNDCNPNPCLNGGTCTQISIGEASIECTCTPAYTGARCESELFCVPGKCLNGATCNEDTQSCTCVTGFTGQSCETELQCVTNNPCNMTNTLTCVEADPTPTCDCKSGFRGATCNEMIMCDPNPCLNGGTCNDTTGQAMCTCAVGYTGSECQTDLFCEPNPCVNGGTCDESAGTCACPTGFAPPTCSGTDPCNPNPCGNGTCDSTASPVCSCPDGSSGSTCAGSSGLTGDDDGFNETVFIAVMAGVGGLLLLALLVCLICYCARSEGTYYGSKERLARAPPPQSFQQPALAFVPSAAAAPSIIMAGSYVPANSQFGSPVSTLRPPVSNEYVINDPEPPLTVFGGPTRGVAMPPPQVRVRDFRPMSPARATTPRIVEIPNDAPVEPQIEPILYRSGSARRSRRGNNSVRYTSDLGPRPISSSIRSARGSVRGAIDADFYPY